MAFRFKNLMVHVLPEAAPGAPQPGPQPTPPCRVDTCGFNFVTHPCTAIYSLCGPASACGPRTHGCGIDTCGINFVTCGPLSVCGPRSHGCGVDTCGLNFVTGCTAINSLCGPSIVCHFGTCAGLTCLAGTGCGPSCHFPTGGCGGLTCGGATLLDITPNIAASGPTELAALQEQLKALQQNIADRVAAQDAAMKPQTLAEADALEQQLTAALDELRTQKDALKKGTTG